MPPVRKLGRNQAFGGLYGSFARGRAGGGVAGVVITGTPLAPEVMQRVAADFAAPTTGFIAAGGPYNLAFGEPGAGSPRPVRLAVKVLGHEAGADAGLVQKLTGLDLLGDYRPEIVS